MMAFSGAALAQPAPRTLEVTVIGLAGGRLRPSNAYCAPAGTPPARYNISPAIRWSRGPKGTRSYALVMTDLDVPKDLSLMNKPGIMIASDTPRVPFIHWTLIDIPPRITRLPKGAGSPGFVAMGKPPGLGRYGITGANVFSFFYPKGSPLAGIRGGYDGPCPPTNDPLPHRYVTRIYALDLAELGLAGDFFGEEALARMEGHVLATGEATALAGGESGLSPATVPPAPRE